MIVSLWWKSWKKRPKSCQCCLVHLLWWCCLIQLGCVFVHPWFITLGWGLCKWDNARRDWWRSHSLQTGAGSALLLLKKLFHSEMVQMTPSQQASAMAGSAALSAAVRRENSWSSSYRGNCCVEEKCLKLLPGLFSPLLSHSICSTACVCLFSSIDSECCNLFLSWRKLWK